MSNNKVLKEGLMAGITFPMARGPYQDNGAAPWYAPLTVGTSTPPQVQNFALDTGTNMVWATSTQCTTTACMMHNRFDAAQSGSFCWINTKEQDLDYGVWGNLKANIGRDAIALPGGGSVDLTFGLAIDYSGPKFQEVDWDGCIAFPSKGPMQHGFSFFMEDLVNGGHVDPLLGLVCFDWDHPAGQGTCRVGDVDLSKLILNEGMFLPYGAYTNYDLLWTATNATILTGPDADHATVVDSGITFGFDSGSSRFKGDVPLLTKLAGLLGPGQDTLVVEVGTATGSGGPVRLVVPPDIYMRTIEAGQNAGTTSAQFHPLKGVDGLMIVGSVLMDYLYTVYLYETAQDPATGKYACTPFGTWVFNKPGGPKIVQPATACEAPSAEAVFGRPISS